MKDNVDLTEKRNFRKTRPSLPAILFQGKTFPFKMKPKDNWEPFSELILTGNKKQRSYKQIAQSCSVPDNCCDCCGDTNPLHFIARDSICDRCKKVLEDKTISKLF